MRIKTRAMVTAILWSTAAALSAQAPVAGEDIRGPKPMVEIPQPRKPPVTLWLGLGGGALALAVAAWWWHQRRRRLRLKSPVEIALWSLAELDANREAVAAEAFANRAAQTVRQYIADRFGLAAPRRTTEEFLRDLAKDEGSPLSAEGDHLRVFLKSCDLAKFAALPLDSGQRGEIIRTARGFITATGTPVVGSAGNVVKARKPPMTQPMDDGTASAAATVSNTTPGGTAP
jgi:hypothetical protein